MNLVDDVMAHAESEQEWELTDADPQLVDEFLTGTRALFRLWIFVALVGLQCAIVALIWAGWARATHAIANEPLWKVGGGILLAALAIFVAYAARRRKLWALRVLLALTYGGLGGLLCAAGESIIQNSRQPGLVVVGLIILSSLVVWKAHVGIRAGARIVREGAHLRFKECRRCGNVVDLSSRCPVCTNRPDARHPFPISGVFLILASVICWLLGFWGVGFALATLWIAPFTFGFGVIGIFFMLVGSILLAVGIMKCRRV